MAPNDAQTMSNAAARQAQQQAAQQPKAETTTLATGPVWGKGAEAKRKRRRADKLAAVDGSVGRQPQHPQGFTQAEIDELLQRYAPEVDAPDVDQPETITPEEVAELLERYPPTDEPVADQPTDPREIRRLRRYFRRLARKYGVEPTSTPRGTPMSYGNPHA